MSHTHNKQTHILKSTNNSRAQRHKQDPPKRIRWSSNWSNEHVTITRYAINWQNVLVGLTCGYSCCRNRRQPNRPSEISCRLHPRKQNTIYSEWYTAQYNDHDDLVSLFCEISAAAPRAWWVHYLNSLKPQCFYPNPPISVFCRMKFHFSLCVLLLLFLGTQVPTPDLYTCAMLRWAVSSSVIW